MLDVGCGHGYFSRLLAAKEATVVGVDVSDALIARAEADETAAPLGVTFQQTDVAEIGHQFDARKIDPIERKWHG